MSGGEKSFASASEQRVARAAAEAAPHAAELLASHLAANHELLPILYLDALGVWYLQAWRDRDADPDQFTQAGAVAAVLDAEFKKDAKLENAIAVGFVEMFTYLPEHDRAAAATLPPALRAEYTKMAAWRPS
ncbi:hypothetical protein VSH64_36640 [Amycolatopsis rhabdoformis]|uniref:Uncharacterized protein n=1 Tax=Amycolatopsis rhabdoformis TaxID=1448059 RepID=A0ABZ1I314_9PSEU|nr:hypothetical protein [Amycolatopsis rhabdoformis]WSE28326.1 hypothetical protein VSH64_36640 [Amycolatopsis rhabdoformis]